MIPDFPSTTFTGRHVFTTLDRDGYEEDVFVIHILLRFYPDGTVHGVEDDVPRDGRDGAGDDIRDDHDLEGRWEIDEADGPRTRFELKRIRPAKKRNNAIPGDGSNYYSYPTVATVAHMADGSYTALFTEDTLIVFDDVDARHRYLDFELHGPSHPDFPRHPVLAKVKDPGCWCSFQHTYRETRQWTPEADETEVDLGFCIRFHAQDHRVEVLSTGRGIGHDLFPWAHPTLTGTWEEQADGTYILDLGKTDKDRSCYGDDIKDAPYRAGYFGGRLCLQRIVGGSSDYGREDRFYDIAPVSREGIWLKRLDRDPLAEARARFEADKEEASRSFQQSNQRRAGQTRKTEDDPSAADHNDRPSPKSWIDHPAVEYVIAAIVWILILWALVEVFS